MVIRSLTVKINLDNGLSCKQAQTVCFSLTTRLSHGLCVSVGMLRHSHPWVFSLDGQYFHPKPVHVFCHEWIHRLPSTRYSSMIDILWQLHNGLYYRSKVACQHDRGAPWRHSPVTQLQWNHQIDLFLNRKRYDSFDMPRIHAISDGQGRYAHNHCLCGWLWWAVACVKQTYDFLQSQWKLDHNGMSTVKFIIDGCIAYLPFRNSRVHEYS